MERIVFLDLPQIHQRERAEEKRENRREDNYRDDEQTSAKVDSICAFLENIDVDFHVSKFVLTDARYEHYPDELRDKE